MKDKTKTGLGMRGVLIFGLGELGLRFWERTNFGVLVLHLFKILLDQEKEKKEARFKSFKKSKFGNYSITFLVMCGLGKYPNSPHLCVIFYGLG